MRISDWSSDVCSSDLSDILSQGKFAIDMDAVKHFDPGILVRQLRRQFVEIGAVLFCPPIVQVAFPIKLGTLIVKAVAEFVSDNRHDTAIIDRVDRKSVV